ncbi:hypothetical protein EGK68_23780 [Enterobacter cloacae]|uniref:Uncharacterized protein n=1 Tax=Enterobacter cloacae TaxID=550 RepID=A0A3R8YVU9_ENTCL|nr:hypothetical protein EGK68_23780 [Enterobacter cloacae]
MICNQRLNDDDYRKIIKNVVILTPLFDEKISNEIIIRLLKMGKIALTSYDFSNLIYNIAVLSSEFIMRLLPGSDFIRIN